MSRFIDSSITARFGSPSVRAHAATLLEDISARYDATFTKYVVHDTRGERERTSRDYKASG